MSREKENLPPLSDEERRHRETIRVTKFSIIVGAVTLIICTLIGGWFSIGASDATKNHRTGVVIERVSDEGKVEVAEIENQPVSESVPQVEPVIENLPVPPAVNDEQAKVEAEAKEKIRIENLFSTRLAGIKFDAYKDDRYKKSIKVLGKTVHSVNYGHERWIKNSRSEPAVVTATRNAAGWRVTCKVPFHARIDWTSWENELGARKRPSENISGSYTVVANYVGGKATFVSISFDKLGAHDVQGVGRDEITKQVKAKLETIK